MKLDPPRRHLITAALPYANGPLHIGHIAGAYLPADIYVRYLRLKGEDVLFVCGSDEHGAAITLRAKKENSSPQEIVDKYHEINKQAFEDFGLSFDIYHRTSSELHHETAREFFLELYNKGVFEEQSSKQFYDEKYDQFLADRYITGTCPKCSYEGAYGDQCEKCGSSLNPEDLIDPVSTLSGEKPILKETTHWYLPMGKEENWLRQWIELGILDGKQQHNPMKWRNPVLGQCKSWLDSGLHSRAMTRDLDWGVKVPLENSGSKVLYVWLDAPIGYISASKKWANEHGEDWEKYWKDTDCSLVHFIGKDNIVFHCIIFPILLKLHGGFVLPRNVPANEFLNLEGNKISTSRNWAVWLDDYLREFPEKEDVLKYVLCSIAPETKDSEFTWKDFQTRNNSELVGIFGNFVNRTMVLCHKYYGGAVPEVSVLDSTDSLLFTTMQKHVDALKINIENFQFRDALSEALSIARMGNKFLAETEPWKIIKVDPERVQSIMNIAVQICANLSLVFEPFMPKTAKKLREMMNLEGIGIEDWGKPDLIKSGHQLNKASLLFEKIEDDVIEKQIEKLRENSDKQAKPKGKAMIEFTDFEKLELKTGTILSAEKMPKSKKLLKLKVDLGDVQKNILSGIAEHYTEEEIIGKQVLVLNNLPPRKMMGVESEGMILMAEDAEGKLSFMSPDKQIQDGSAVR